MHWQGQDLVIENYLSGSTMAADELTVQVLAAFDDWTDARDVASLFPHYEPGSVLESVEQLVAATFLVPEGNDDDETLESAWPYWGQEARFFHFATKDAPFVSGELALDHMDAFANETPPPSLKRYPDAPRTYLPRAFLDFNVPFRDVLLEWRTTRRFLAVPIGLRAFSTLLFYTFSPMYFGDAGALGIVPMKTFASGGARHETEFYIGVLNVEGIDRGLYHYCAEDHALELLNADWCPERAADLCCGQEWVAHTGFVCFVSARFERMAWKYRHPRAYRVVLMNLGHAGQTFSLVATALGLAPFVTAAIRETGIDAALGLDGFWEGVMSVLACGVPEGMAAGQLPREVALAQAVTRPIVGMFPTPPPQPAWAVSG